MTVKPQQKRTPPAPKLAVILSLPADTPDNVVRMIAGEYLANNEAHQIKDTYDTNNTPDPPALTKKVIAS